VYFLLLPLVGEGYWRGEIPLLLIGLGGLPEGVVSAIAFFRLEVGDAYSAK